MPPPDAKTGLAPSPEITRSPTTPITPEATPLVDPRARAMAAALRGLSAAGAGQSEAEVRSLATHESGGGDDGEMPASDSMVGRDDGDEEGASDVSGDAPKASEGEAADAEPVLVPGETRSEAATDSATDEGDVGPGPADGEPVATVDGEGRKEAEDDKEKTPREYLAERRVKGNSEMMKLKRNLEMIREMMTEMRARVDKARMVFTLASEVYGAGKFDGEVGKLEKVDDFLKTLERTGEDSWEPKIAASEASLQGEMEGLPESRQVADKRGNVRELAIGESPKDDEQMMITVDATDIDRDKKANIASLNEKLREQFGAFFEPAEKKLGTTWLRNSEANTNWNLLNQLDRQARGLAGQMVEEALDTESDLTEDERAKILAKRKDLESYEGEGDMGKKWSRWEVGGLVAGALAAYTVIRLTKEGADQGIEDAGIERKSKGVGGGLSWMQKMKMLSMGFTPEQVMFLDKKSKQDAKVAAEAAKADTAEEVTASTGVAPPPLVAPAPAPAPPPTPATTT